VRHTQLINYALYRIGWFACVLGGASQRPWTGCLIALILIGVTFRYSMRPVMMRPIRAALLGAAGGPLAFFAGDRRGAVTLLPPLAPPRGLRISTS